MTRSSTPRRIPTDEIEVGKWYRVEDAVPSNGCLMVEEMASDSSSALYAVVDLERKGTAWRYNGPIPDELPPREERPKRFTAGSYEGKLAIFQGKQPFLVDPASLALGIGVQEICDLLNAGHEALQARRGDGALP